MITISSSELEPVKVKKEPKEPKEPKEKLDCKECGNDRSCKYCQLRQKNEIAKMKSISLALVRCGRNKWIPDDEKLEYFDSLGKLVIESYGKI